MKLCRTYHGVFGAWGWEDIKQNGVVEESRDVFESFDECVEDARRHGYTVGRAPRPQPRSMPRVCALPPAGTKSTVAA